jgi:HSP20 family molecular chaperone IbpA
VSPDAIHETVMITSVSRLLADESLLQSLTRPAMFSSIPVTKGPSSIRYNVRVDESDNSAVYEIALPGHTKEDVEVRYSANRLTVSSNKMDTDTSGYVVHMFGKRAFSLSWAVSDAKVSEATMSDGVLRIVVSRTVNDSSDLVPVT